MSDHPGFRSWFNDLYWARREPGAANAQNRNVSKSFFLLGTPCATVADSTHHTDAGNLAQRHRPIAFAAEGLRLALCFAFNCGIRDHMKERPTLIGSLTQTLAPRSRRYRLRGSELVPAAAPGQLGVHFQHLPTAVLDGNACPQPHGVPPSGITPLRGEGNGRAVDLQ